MKIGILTLPLHTNYGGILQTYALQTVLQRMGHETLIYDNGLYSMNPFLRVVFLCKKIVKSTLCLDYKFFNEVYDFCVFKAFVIKHLRLTANKNFSRDYNTNNLDLIVVGSDQVWRSAYSSDISYYYLNFASSWKIKRIAYAASFGEDEWKYTERETQKCSYFLSLFDAVSVREQSAVQLSRKYLNMDVEVVLDPTLLLSQNDYLRLLDQSNNTDKNHLLVYMLDWTQTKKDLVSSLSNMLEIPCLEIGHVNDKAISLGFWLNGFYSSQYVITDSFHGCVFAIIFNKPFVALANKERGETRFLSLLSQLGLADRLISSGVLVKEKMLQPINWEEVNRKKDELKELSFKFLKKYVV